MFDRFKSASKEATCIHFYVKYICFMAFKTTKRTGCFNSLQPAFSQGQSWLKIEVKMHLKFKQRAHLHHEGSSRKSYHVCGHHLFWLVTYYSVVEMESEAVNLQILSQVMCHQGLRPQKSLLHLFISWPCSWLMLQVNFHLIL